MNKVVITIGGVLIVAIIVIGVVLLLRNHKKNSENYKSSYALVDNWKGTDLRPEQGKGWQYFSQPDPTHGNVTYGVFPELLTELPGNKLKISVDTTRDKVRNVCDSTLPIVPVKTPLGYVPVRNSIRLYTGKTYNSGLFVMDIDHIPAGLSVWSAFWLVSNNAPTRCPCVALPGAPYTLDGRGSPSWPCGGEIDIIEGVNSSDVKSSSNSVTLHTSPGCDQSGNTNPNMKFADMNCNAGRTDWQKTCGCAGNEQCPTQGCGILMDDQRSFGYNFNTSGGGVYACELTPEGQITIWFWSRNDPTYPPPSDLQNTNPNPDSWKVDPKNKLVFTPCPNIFWNMQLTLNTTLCGDWAGNVFPGGMNACLDYIDKNDLPEAYWIINSVKVFQKN